MAENEGALHMECLTSWGAEGPVVTATVPEEVMSHVKIISMLFRIFSDVMRLLRKNSDIYLAEVFNRTQALLTPDLVLRIHFVYSTH